MALTINRDAFEERAKDLGFAQPYAVTVAEKAKLGTATVYRALRGEEFNSGTLEKLATALHCSPIDLLKFEGYVDPLLAAQAACAVPA